MMNYTDELGAGEDTGHSLEWIADVLFLRSYEIHFNVCEDSSFGTFDLDDATYELIQFHIHTGSEHTVPFQDLYLDKFMNL